VNSLVSSSPLDPFLWSPYQSRTTEDFPDNISNIADDRDSNYQSSTFNDDVDEFFGIDSDTSEEKIDPIPLVDTEEKEKYSNSDDDEFFVFGPSKEIINPPPPIDTGKKERGSSKKEREAASKKMMGGYDDDEEFLERGKILFKERGSNGAEDDGR
jgi:hypothetical protein